MKECTFAPELITRTSWDKAKAAADRKRTVEEFYRQHPMSGVGGGGGGASGNKTPKSNSKMVGVGADSGSGSGGKRNLEPPRRFTASQSNSGRYNSGNINPNISARKSIGGGGRQVDDSNDISIPKVTDNAVATRAVMSVRELLTNKSNLTPASRGHGPSASQTARFSTMSGSASYSHGNGAGADLAAAIGATVVPVQEYAVPRPYFE